MSTEEKLKIAFEALRTIALSSEDVIIAQYCASILLDISDEKDLSLILSKGEEKGKKWT